jgi:hypothetical protein
MTNAEKMKLAIERLEEAKELMIDTLGDLDFVQDHLVLIDTMIDELAEYRLEELENEQNG